MSESVRQYLSRVRDSCGVPFDGFLYDCANEIESMFQPATVHESNTLDYHYFFKYFMTELYGIIRVDDFPKDWNKEFFIWNLICRGWLAIVNAESYGGWIPQPCVFGAGRNVFAFPTSVLVQNGWFNPDDGRIEFYLYDEWIPETRDSFGNPVLKYREKQAYIIKISPDYRGIADICAQYAGKAASLFATIDNSSILSRNGYILETDSKAESMTVEKAVEGILNGELIVSIKKKRQPNKPGAENSKIAEIFESDVKKHYIVTEALEDLQTIVDQFHAAIGFPIINRAKKERTIQAEQEAMNVPASVRPDLWERCLQESIADFNRERGYNIKIDLKYQGGDYGTLSQNTADSDNSKSTDDPRK